MSAIREKMSLRSLGCFTSICKKYLRKQRLNKIIEDGEREKREEELRVLMEGERKRLVRERKRRERERREEVRHLWRVKRAEERSDEDASLSLLALRTV